MKKTKTPAAGESRWPLILAAFLFSFLIMAGLGVAQSRRRALTTQAQFQNLPSHFPSEVPIYPHSTHTKNMVMTLVQGEGKRMVVYFSSNNDTEEYVHTFYEAKMVEQGWEIKDRSPKSLTFSKQGREVEVSTFQEIDGNVLYTISYVLAAE